MKGIAAALAAAVVLAGCTVTVYPEVLDEHRGVCADNGGVKYWRIDGGLSPDSNIQSVTCRNGAKFDRQALQEWDERGDV